MNKKCKNCLIHKQMIESKEPSCCAWYIDNVVLGNKSVDECTEHIDLDNDSKKEEKMV